MAEDLERFVTAQDRVWPAVTAELAAGAKRSHWMWFVFPQIVGLGTSPTAQRYAIASLAEARGYLDHPVLGPRLLEATRLMLHHRGRAPEAILGTVDAMKFRSSMTLFREARPEAAAFGAALDGFFGGEADERTLALVGRGV
jgi:uncharacterized protein (DUF1810 family)